MFDTRNNMIALQDWYCGRFLFDISLFLLLLESGCDDDNNYGHIRYDNKIHFWTWGQFPVHAITIAKKQWSPMIFNMATIFTKEVKDVSGA